MENKIEEFEKALTDVRRAHRLLFKYQERMLDLMAYIKSRLDFPEFMGKKHFSNAIGARRSGSGMQRIRPDMWAWDFLYCYTYEYFLGEIKLDKYRCQLKIVQYSDTGYFDLNDDEASQIDLDRFAPEETSVSKLLFIFEAVPTNQPAWKWNSDELIRDKKYASASHSKETIEQDNSRMILYSLPLARFIDERSTLEALAGFCSYCEENGLPGLEIV